MQTFQRNIEDKVYKALEDDLRENILKGLLSPDKPILTEPELEVKYKISRKSVRKAIQNLCDEGLLKKTQGKGTFVIPPADRLKTNSRKNLKILFLTSAFIPGEKISSEYEEALVSGMSELAYRMNWQLSFSLIDNLSIRDITSQYKDSKFDGIIWDNTHSSHNKIISSFMGNGIPQVLIDRYLNNVCSVYFDHHTEITDTVSFLASLGHKRIAFINSDSGEIVYKEREDAFFSSLKNLNLKNDYYFRISHLKPFNEFKVLSSALNPPTALLLGGHSFLPPFLAWAGSRKLRFPEDISLICLDDSWLAKTNNPPISVYAEPRNEIGKQALTALERLINGQMRPGEQIRIKGDIIARKSCGLPKK
ncbi:MAG: hypothetical protein A2017_22255 [Lentisphaerae bacterium GWF2_44_16]|nr:MAG: hypothetical protein A2017_22255 [Lentisphaerae bacterium GWF2_44_16]